jgi:hypothetical protein
MTLTGGPLFPARGDSQQGLNLLVSREMKPHMVFPGAPGPGPMIRTANSAGARSPVCGCSLPDELMMTFFVVVLPNVPETPTMPCPSCNHENRGGGDLGRRLDSGLH